MHDNMFGCKVSELSPHLNAEANGGQLSHYQRKESQILEGAGLEQTVIMDWTGSITVNSFS